MDYKIRRGRRGGRHDAISNADRYEGPICTGICTAGGAPGPGGAGRRLLPPTELKSEQEFTSQNLVKVVSRFSSAPHVVLYLCRIQVPQVLTSA